MSTPNPSRNKRIAAAAALAAAIAIPAEGIRQVAYYDPPGILTVCFGSTKNVEKGKVYTVAECRQRLDVDMAMAIDSVDRCVPNLPDGVLAAFGDAVYNIGPKIACDTEQSTAARLLKLGRLQEACDELPRWNKSRILGVSVTLPGLTNRRNAERALCLKGLTP